MWWRAGCGGGTVAEGTLHTFSGGQCGGGHTHWLWWRKKVVVEGTQCGGGK